MYKLFIVEDEEIMREGIQKNIDWVSNGVEIVGTAGNGRECLEQIEKHMPQVILTDIKMPFMDGMELIQHLYELYPSIKVVLLTAFDEFEYAKKALDYKVCQYIMKYEDNEKILNAVLKAGKEYENSINQMEIIKQSEKLLENKILRNLLFHEEKYSNIESDIYKSRIRFDYNSFFVSCIVLIKDKNKGNYTDTIGQEYENLKNNIKNLEGKVKLYFCNTEEKLCIISNFNNEESEIYYDFIKKLEQMLQKEKVSFKVKCSVGQVYTKLSDISKSYEECRYLISSDEVNQSIKKNIIIVSNKYNDSYNSNGKTINQIIEYIKTHYYEKDICLDTIAKYVHLTPAYVSALFKKKKNYNISDYIIKIRIERAKYFLANTDMKTYEIADAIGYVNSQYFSVLFKRSTGVSPTEYRQKKTLEIK